MKENKRHGVALKFTSRQKFRDALSILFQQEIPHTLVGDLTIIISPDKIHLFERLKPEQSDVLSAAELDPEEIAELRREYLSFHEDDE